MKIFAETERFILREILPTDVEGFFEMDSDPEVHRYLGNKPVKSRAQVVEIIEFIRQQYIDHGIGRWAIVDKENNDFIGWTGLKFITELTNNHKYYYDLGYRLLRKYWGKGIATETALASLNYAFREMKLDEVIGIADYENVASNNVLKKAGLKFIECFDYEGTPHNWYRIDGIEFKNRK
ncbi:MAG: GNAT family N-acetyltransferase [Ginsengibacter sp.]